MDTEYLKLQEEWETLIKTAPKMIEALVKSSEVLGEIAKTESPHADMAFAAFTNNMRVVMEARGLA